MASSNLSPPHLNGDFVLDEGLEQEDEILTPSIALNGEADNPSHDSKKDANKANQDDKPDHVRRRMTLDDAVPVLQRQSCSVIVQDFPAEGKKKDLDEFFNGCGQIVETKVRRLPDSSFVVLIVFDDSASKDMALLLNNTEMYPGKKIHIIPGGQNWDEYVARRERECGFVEKSKTGLSLGFLAPGNIGKAFWGTVGTVAKGAAELDSMLGIKDKVNKIASTTKNVLDDFDKQFEVGERAAKVGEAGKVKADELAKTASDFDQKLGISNKVSSMAQGVAKSSRIAAREVDESLGVSDKARSLTNTALQNEGFASGVKAARDSWSEFLEAGQDVLPPHTPQGKKRKNIEPSGDIQASPVDQQFFGADEPVTPKPDDDDLEF